MTFLIILEVAKILCTFKLAPEGKTGKDSSILEFLEKFSVNSFALSDGEDSTSGPLNRGSIAGLPLLRTLLAIHQNRTIKITVWDPHRKVNHLSKVI